jgi:hypothetical protein
MGKIKQIYMDLINSGVTPDGLSLGEALDILKQKENEEGEQYARLQSGEQENSREA